MEVALFYCEDRKHYLTIKNVDYVIHYGELSKFSIQWNTLKGIRMEATYDSKQFYFIVRGK